MAKVSAQRNSFNAGEFSVLVEGRTDIDKYPASMRTMKNTIAVPQGPAMRRSGTSWQQAVYDETKAAALVPFVYSEDQSYALEFSDFKMRVHLEDGPQAYSPVAISQTISAAGKLKVRIAVPGSFAVNDHVVLTGFSPTLGFTNVIGKVTVLSNGAADVETDLPFAGPYGAVSNCYIAKIYEIATPYAAASVTMLRYVQSVDVVYLYCDGYRNYTLSRYGAYDWRFAEVAYTDGPYMPADTTGAQLTITGDAGSAIPSMTSNSNPSGTVSASSYQAGWEPWKVFNPLVGGKGQGGWRPITSQTGWVQYLFAEATAIKGYTVYPAASGEAANNDTYAPLDFAPADWRFQGTLDGVNWIDLDTQQGYVLWENNRSVFFPVNYSTPLKGIRLLVEACRRNGPISPRIGFIGITKLTPGFTNIVIDKPASVNKGAGFLPTDVGRLIRIKDTFDATWRWLKLTGYNSASQMTGVIQGETFFLPSFWSTAWRLGYFSDTTGWPTCATFFEDRLFVAGPSGFPDLLCGSRSGAYTDMQQATTADAVLDDSALVFRLNARKLSRIRWMQADDRGLLLGTGSQEFVVKPADDNNALTARNVRARPLTAYGSANVEALKVDRQILYVPGSRKSVRELAYVFESDGYKSPSMSLFASHLGAQKFANVDYAQDPHSIVWVRRADGSIVGLTYNRDENVVGWHQHDFGGVVENICVIPSARDNQDTLWMVIRRTINNVQHRYIERLSRFWDFDMGMADAQFLDCALRYTGAATNTVYGLPFPNGAVVDVLADGRYFKDVPVTNRSITLANSASNILVGLPYVSFAEISRLEVGAADGASQGKTKRAHNVVPFIWSSFGGEVGKWNDTIGDFEFDPIDYPEVMDELEELPTLQTFLGEPQPLPPGYDNRGTLAFRQTEPYPFNVIALLPQMNTQDR